MTEGTTEEKIKITEGKVEEKKYLVTSERCPHCSTAKEMLKKFLESGEIEELLIKTDDDIKVAMEMGIHAVPTLLRCKIDNKNKKMECEHIDIDKFIKEKD